MAEDKGQAGAATNIIGAVITFILVFYVISSTYSPMETAVGNLQSNIGGAIANESLGTASGEGNLTATVNYPPIASGYTIYNGTGIPHGDWVNTTLSVSAGIVTIGATGLENSTASSAITIDYARDVAISGVSDLNALPGVALLLFVLVTIFGVIILAVRSGGGSL